ncbi:MAG: lysine 2,3-aminomutase, partial [Syntrophaceticus sp.]
MAIEYNETTAHHPEHLHKQSDSETRRQYALERAAELREKIKDYLNVKDQIHTGFDLVDEYETARSTIIKALGASDTDWDDWHWQLNNRINTVELLSLFVDLTDEEKEELNEVSQQLRWALSPYYMALVMCDKPHGGVWKQSIPSKLEITDTKGSEDPMAEGWTSPAPGVTRRYPDRMIINVTNRCAMFCRHCQRRRNIGIKDSDKTRTVLEE